MGKKSSGIKQDADGFDLPSDEVRLGIVFRIINFIFKRLKKRIFK